MKKTLDAATIVNELRGQSAFFPTRQTEQPKEQQSQRTQEPEPLQETSSLSGLTSPMRASEQASNDASKHASTLATQPDIIELIRKIVKTPAKEEVLYVRITKEEKNQLGDIEYTYDRKDIDTSANELGRIAVNFLIADYKANGEQSILAKVLTALHA